MTLSVLQARNSRLSSVSRNHHQTSSSLPSSSCTSSLPSHHCFAVGIQNNMHFVRALLSGQQNAGRMYGLTGASRTTPCVVWIQPSEHTRLVITRIKIYLWQSGLFNILGVCTCVPNELCREWNWAAKTNAPKQKHWLCANHNKCTSAGSLQEQQGMWPTWPLRECASKG